jgi:putative ABC transport system permease protein
MNIPFKTAIQVLEKNKLRSFLTLFGILVGIAMVIIVLSAGNGLKQLILGEVSSFGNNWINIEVKVPDTQKNSRENSRAIASGVMIKTLTTEDAEAIKSVENIEDAYAGITSQAVVSYGIEKVQPTIFGVSDSYIRINPSSLVEGRFFDREENVGAAQVVVLGFELKNTLFGNTEAVGNTIKVSGKSFLVVGVMESLGAGGFMDMDTIMYVPVKTVQKKLMGIDHVIWIIASMKDMDKAEDTAEEVRAMIRERHGMNNPDKDDFSVTTMTEAVSLVSNIVFGITVLLVTLASVSLLVGGVGIMNVMYVSVAERTFEIGLRKAVGATDRDILEHFLTEAVLLTVTGGIMGIIAGVIFSLFITVLAQSQGLDWPFHISLISIIVSTAFAIAVGLIFGVMPARRAAELDPIVAIRQE